MINVHGLAHDTDQGVETDLERILEIEMIITIVISMISIRIATTDPDLGIEIDITGKKILFYGMTLRHNLLNLSCRKFGQQRIII